MDNLILFTLSQESQYEQIRRHIECFVKEWTEDITQEMPIIQNQSTIHGK